MGSINISVTGTVHSVAVDGIAYVPIGGSAAPGPISPTVDGGVPAITFVPSISGDLSTGLSTMQYANTAPGVVVGMSFVVTGAQNEAMLKWEGHPAKYWNRNSWAVFNSGGQRVMNGDNEVPAGTLGGGIDVRGLSPGTYTFALSVDGSGRMAFIFNQN